MKDSGNVLARAHGDAVLAARMRVTPEDFRVDEIDGFEASGSGEHLLLTVEKRGMNTAFAARQIASWAGIAEMGVGYAGLKDRHAVTRQRFSVHLPKRVAPDLAALESEEMRIVHHQWHAKKMPRGALAGNRFELILRDVQGDRAAIDARLQAIAARGVPNYFGEQRFGRAGDNVDNALAMFAGLDANPSQKPARPCADFPKKLRREQRSLLLSAARSELFNRVLARRVSDDCWDRPLDGEAWILDGSRSVFGPEPWNEVLAARLAEFDIHPSGPLWGRGELRCSDAAHELEVQAVSVGDGAALCAGLEAAGLKQERRALRLRAQAMAWDWPSSDMLHLRFELPAGCYATVMLAELGSFNDV